MGKGFNIAETFGEVLRGVSNSDTDTQQIIRVDIDLLHDDPNNFYSMEGVEELAANIETVGLQQPPLVRPDPDRAGEYIVVSGHRRKAALQVLVDSGRADLRSVPCLLDTSDVPPEMQELRLIFANSATREISGADKAKQAERVTELLYKLKEQGYEFPGRMRDHVAEACQISTSKLARLKVIQENLYGPIRCAWESGVLSEASAYLLARQDPEIQETVHRKYSSTAWNMTTEDLQKVVDRCKSDAMNRSIDKLDEIIRKKKQSEQSLLDAGKDYVEQLQKDDARFFSVLRKAANGFIYDLVRDLPTTRHDSIERLRVANRHHGACGGGVDFQGSNKGLTIDDLSRHPITRSWTEVWDILAVIALHDWGVNRAEKRKNLAERQALRDDRQAMEDAPVFKWSPVGGYTPQRVPLLTKTPTNAGVQYRVAQWDGVNWADPNNSAKILTGLRPSEWLPIPRAGCFCKADPNAEESTHPATFGWISMEEARPEAEAYVLNVDVDGVMEVDCLELTGEWAGSYGDITHWMPLPLAPGEEGSPIAAAPPEPTQRQSWTPGDTQPDHNCKAVVVFDAGDGVAVEEICLWAGGTWCFSNYSPVGMPALRWVELPKEEDHD